MPNLQDMGNGRYFYVACVNSIGVKVLDSTLLTSSNYSGGGTWSTDPVIATIALQGKICYDGLNKRIVVTQASKTLAFIDADPTSANFNTNIGTVTLDTTLGFGNTFGIGYDYINNLFCIGASNSAALYSMSFEQLDLLPNTNRARWINYYPYRNCFILSDETASADLVFSRLKQNQAGLSLISNSEGYWFATDKYLYNIRINAFDVYDVKTNNRVSSVSIANTRRSSVGFSKKNNLIVTASQFTNSFSFFNTLTMAADGTLAKGFTDTGETGTRGVLANDDVAVAIPYIAGNARYLHVIDINGKAYVGYIDMGDGAFDNVVYENNRLAKNAIEYWEQ